MQGTKARRVSLLQPHTKNKARTNIDYTYTHKYTYIIVWLLLTTYIHNIAIYRLLLTTQEQRNRMNVGLLLIATQKGNRIAYKEKKLYITYIVKKRKGCKRTQKKRD